MEEQTESTVRLSSDSLNALAPNPARYETRGLIGQGGMGMVFRAYDLELHRDVAIKILLYEGASGKESQERFLREAKALAILDHPGIVKIFSSDLNEHGNPYNVMEFLDGLPLSVVLKNGPMNPSFFYLMICQILAGLEHAHNLQIVHRDLKPSNIMQCKGAGEDGVYKIIDFGIARFDFNSEKDAKTLTRTNAVLGSPIYMSPEQCRGERGDFRSDIYSLGCIMYECLTGGPPFQGETAFETMYKHMTESPARVDSPANTPQTNKLYALIYRCLEKKSTDRPQSVTEILAELAQIFDSDLIEQESLSSRKKTRSFLSTFLRAGLSESLRKSQVVLLSMVALSGILLLGLLSFRNSNNSTNDRAVIKTKANSQLRELNDKISRLKARAGGKASSAAMSKNTEVREAYAKELLSLGRLQLRSTLRQDNIDAEKTYRELLRCCNEFGGAFTDLKASCYAFIAKSLWKQGNYAGADSNFAEANKLVKVDTGKWHDLLFEECLFEIRSRRFDDALKDYVALREFYERRYYDDPDFINPELDPGGPFRVEMLIDTARELSHAEPRSDKELLTLLKLSKRLLDAMHRQRFGMGHETREFADYADKLLLKLKGQEDLRKQVSELLTEVRKDTTKKTR